MAIGKWYIDAEVNMSSVRKETSKLKKELKKSGDYIENDIGKRGNKAVSGLTSSFGKLGKAIAGAFAVREIWSFFKNSYLNFVEFEKGLARINTVANVSKKEMRGLGKEIKAISDKYGIAKKELLDTGFNISSAGVEFKNVSKIMELSAITAIGAGTDTTTAFNGIIAVIKKYGENINIAGSIAEKFFIANKLGQTTIEDMAIAMQNLSSSVKPAGVQINELFAILATATGVTGNANQVITQLNGAINALSAPTTESSKLFKKLGIEVGQSVIKEKGFVTVAKEVYDATGGNLEVIRKLIPEIEAQKLIVALATTQNKKYKTSLDQVTNGQGNLKEAVIKMADTQEFKLKVAGSKWANFKTKVGNGVTKIMAWLWDFGQVLKSVFLGTFGYVLGSAGISITGLVHAVWSGLKDILYNFKELGRALPEFIKAGLNNLPGLMSAGIRAMLNVIPGGIGSKIADKLGLDTFGKVFKNVNTDFNFKNTKSSLKNFENNMAKLTKATKKEFENAKNIITGNSKEQQLAIDETIESINKLNQSFGDDTINKLTNRLDKLNKKFKNVKIGTDEYKKLQKEIKGVEEKLFGVNEIQDTLGNTTIKSNKKNSKSTNDVKNKLTQLKNEYSKVENKIQKLDKISEKYAKNSKKYNQDIIDNVRQLNKELNNRKNLLSTEIKNIESESKNQLANRYVTIKERELEIKKELTKVFSKNNNDLVKAQEIETEISILKQKQLEFTSKTKQSTKDSIKLQIQKKEDALGILGIDNESLKLQKELNNLKKEQDAIRSKVGDKTLIEAQRVAGLNETQRILEEEKVKKAQAQKDFDREKAKLDSLLKINNAFLQIKQLDQKQLDDFQKAETFKNWSTEEQELFLKLAREKVSLTQQADYKLSLERQVNNEIINLSNTTMQAQLDNNLKLNKSYNDLISKINIVIAKQRQLSASKNSKGFKDGGFTGYSSGGFTGSGNSNKVAGVVHAGEWVAPSWMLDSLGPVFNKLETMRSGGSTTKTINKTQNNNITVNSQFEAENFLDYANWKL